MDKKTDPQRRWRTSQDHSFRECLVQKSKPESQPLETASRNMAPLASWTQRCAIQLSLHRSTCCPEVWSADNQTAVPSRSTCAEGCVLEVTPCEGQPTSRDQARRGHKFPPFEPSTGHCEGQYVLQSPPRGRPGLRRLTPRLLYCFCPNVLPHSSLSRCGFQRNTWNPNLCLRACICHLHHQPD